ncbi:ATP-binding protein [Actinomadura sp. DC4]|uniref:sensor histidine kinase n=1 Tax=Actinomadura sp. DC4 TaxID=3055069 RepID=UPI0025B1B7B7|nr:ATP-binding protein [Actinomadura sp. DC4]MDN3358651.1 ATP-binding protein [Actinomadura sp. DC4]
MPDHRSSRGLLRLLRPRRSTVRLRLTFLQGALFLASGAALIGITYLLAVAEFPARHTTQGLSGTGTTTGGSAGVSTGKAPHESVQTAQRAADLHQFLTESVIALVITVILSVGLGWLVAGRILRPLRTMTTSTRQIFEDNLHERLAVQGPRDELKELGDTIDGLLARLEAAFEAQRRFVANASHELRTPLTLEQTMLEVALADPAATAETLRSTCEDVLASSRQQERLIDALLTLARSQRGLDHRQVFDLGAVAASVLQAARPHAEHAGLHLRAALTPVQVSGDPRLAERLVANLVDNALRYNVPDGTVDVTVGGSAVLTVTNTGPVTPADQIERLLQPFQRMAAGRSGVQDGLGLGLSIVAAVAKAHDALLDVRPGPHGGLRIMVSFAVSQAAGRHSGRGAHRGNGLVRSERQSR